MSKLYTMAEFSQLKSHYADFHYPALLEGEYSGYCVAGHWSQHAILHLLVQLSDSPDKLDLCFFRNSYNQCCFKEAADSFVEQNVRFKLEKCKTGNVYCRNIEVI